MENFKFFYVQYLCRFLMEAILKLNPFLFCQNINKYFRTF